MGGTRIVEWRCGCYAENYLDSEAAVVLRIVSCEEHDKRIEKSYNFDERLLVAVRASNDKIEKLEKSSYETLSRNIYMRVLVRLALDNLKSVYPDQESESVDGYNRAVTLLEEIEKRQARDWPTGEFGDE